MDLDPDRGAPDETSPPPTIEPAAEPRPMWRWTRGDTARTTGAAAVLLATAVLATRGVSSAESSVFDAINRLPDAWYWVLWPIMQLGNVLVAMAVALVVGMGLRRWRVAIALVAAPLIAWELAKVVKALVARGRPDTLLATVHQRGPAELGFGFISGHATVSFALAGVLAAHLRRPWSAVLFAVAAVVAFARVYVGVHLPLDVLGGAACGVLIGEAMRAIEIVAARRSARASI